MYFGGYWFCWRPLAQRLSEPPSPGRPSAGPRREGTFSTVCWREPERRLPSALESPRGVSFHQSKSCRRLPALRGSHRGLCLILWEQIAPIKSIFCVPSGRGVGGQGGRTKRFITLDKIPLCPFGWFQLLSFPFTLKPPWQSLSLFVFTSHLLIISLINY